MHILELNMFYFCYLREPIVEQDGQKRRELGTKITLSALHHEASPDPQ